MSAKQFFTDEQLKQIEQSIAAAELNTSGEIRVHIDKHCKDDVLKSATHAFNTLKMHKTEQRNGILFYLAVEDKKFAIIGDKGINEKVEDGFWDAVRDIMKTHFGKSEFTQGLCEGIKLTGEKLKIHFPYLKDDVNELSNQVSVGK
jgi:uncharacterized membrane protein